MSKNKKYNGLTRRKKSEIFKAQNGVCYLCGEAMRLPYEPCDTRMLATIDHVFPRSSGGSHSSLNILLAHRHCNLLKSERMPFPCEVLYLVSVQRKRLIDRHRKPEIWLSINPWQMRELDSMERAVNAMSNGSPIPSLTDRLQKSEIS